jgi:hypothetical protein
MLICAVALAIQGCGGAADMAPPKAPPAAGAPAPAGPRREDFDSDGIPDEKDAKKGGDDRIAGPPQPKTEDKSKTEQREGAYLIYTAHLTMAVYQVEGALSQVEQIGKDVGGYLANRTDREITIRVPRARFEEAIKRVEGTGDVVHRDVTAEDVTDEFVDTEVRLKNARAMRDRLQQLLEKAPVKEAIEIEKELGRVTQEIERMEGRLKLLKDKIAFSTITVTFDARAAALKTMPLRLPFPWLSSLGLPTLLRLNEVK